VVASGHRDPPSPPTPLPRKRGAKGSKSAYLARVARPLHPPGRNTTPRSPQHRRHVPAVGGAERHPRSRTRGSATSFTTTRFFARSPRPRRSTWFVQPPSVAIVWAVPGPRPRRPPVPPSLPLSGVCGISPLEPTAQRRTCVSRLATPVQQACRRATGAQGAAPASCACRLTWTSRPPSMSHCLQQPVSTKGVRPLGLSSPLPEKA